MKIAKASFAATLLFGFASNGWALVIECPEDGSPDLLGRQATLTSDAATTACEYGTGNPGSGDFFVPGPWVDAGEITGDPGADGDLEVNLTSGSWGSANFEFDWTISSAFWDVYDSAVISMHVGNTRGDPEANPDWFAWLLDGATELDGSTIGTMDYISDTGGGLSNVRLWGTERVSVPEPGTLSLLGAGLLAAGVAGRRRRKKSENSN